MAKGDEKTIKISGDTKDLEQSFAAVQESYARVAKASDDYAAAVEASSKAVTAAEKQVASEHEKTTKKILDGEKRRSRALQDKDKALRAGAKNIKAAEKGEANLAKTQEKGSKAAKAKTMALGAAAVAIGALTAVTGAAVKIAREQVDTMIAQAKYGSDQRAQLVLLKKTFEDYDKAVLEVKKGITLFLSEMNKFRTIFEPAGKMVKWVKDEIVLFVKQATLMAQLFGSMVVNLESFEDAAKRVHKVNKDLKEDAQKYIEEKKKERQVLRNIEERHKAIAEGERKREAERKRIEAERKARHEAWLRRQEEIKKWHESNAEEARDRAQAEREARDAAFSEKMEESSAATQLAQEQELRERLLQLTLEGRDYEAERLEILATSATDSERRLRLEIQQKEELNRLTEEAKAREDALNNARMQGINALSNLGAVALKQAGMQKAAIALVAAKEAGVYFARGLASLGGYDFWGAANYFSASAIAAVEGGAALFGGGGGISKGAGGGGGSNTPAANAPSTMTANTGNVERQPTTINYNLDVHTVAGISNEDARRIEKSVVRASRMSVGGRR